MLSVIIGYVSRRLPWRRILLAVSLWCENGQQAHDVEEHTVRRFVEGGFSVVGEDVAQVHRPAVHERRFQVAHMSGREHREPSGSLVGAQGFDEMPQRTQFTDRLALARGVVSSLRGLPRRSAR